MFNLIKKILNRLFEIFNYIISIWPSALGGIYIRQYTWSRFLRSCGKPRFNGFDISISHVEFSKNNLSVAIVQKTPKSSSHYLHTSKSNDLLHKWSAPLLFLVLIIIIVLK